MKKLLLVVCFLQASVLYSQTAEDSLLSVLPGLKDDSTKVQVYLDLQNEVYRKDLDRALEYATKAADLAGELGLSRMQAEARWVRSNILTELKQFKEAKHECEETLKFFEEANDSGWIASVKMQLAHIARLQGKNELAIANYLEVLTIARELDDKNREALVYNSLGGIHKQLKQYDKALENYQQALDLVREINLIPGISACLTNMADTYNKMKDFDNAIRYHQQALALKIEAGDKLGEARVRNSLGVVYNNLEEFHEASIQFARAHKLAVEVGDKWLTAAIEYGMSRSAQGKGNFNESIRRSLEVLKKIDVFEDASFEIEVYTSLALAYGEIGDYENAFHSSVKARALSDSLYNEKMVQVTNDLEEKYRNQQNEKEIALLESESELKELQLSKRVNERNAIIAIACIVLVLAGLLYSQFRIKQKANLKLKQLDRIRSNFFANITNEFRTPLTLIKGPIEHLEQNPDEKISREDIKMIRRNTTRVLSLVNQLLDLSEISEGILKLEPTEGDVFKFLRAAASSFNSHAAQRHIDYRVRIPQKPLWTSFDRDKLEKIIYNLLGNAFKFSDEGSVVSFEVSHVRQVLQMQVADSGKGIPQSELPFIFDRFYQVDDSAIKEHEGTGIGLALSKDLVELMDGTITVSSELGKGSYFTVHIPMQEIKTGQEQETVNIDLPASNNQEHNTFEWIKNDKRALPTILLVEDNQDMRHFIRDQLSGNYKIQEAPDGNQGLQMARQLLPDLIITDLMMPKMDGIEFCEKIKTHINTSHIPVIMLTARAGVDNRVLGLETGADEYLTKPFNANELKARVKNLVEQRLKLRELFSNQGPKMDPKAVTLTSLDQKFLERLLNLLEENHSDHQFGVPQMQEALALSKSQLHRKIKALTNESPGELLRNFRLKRAAGMLSQKSNTVTQIAYEVGFSDLSYFTKCFKELFGVVPSSYEHS